MSIPTYHAISFLGELPGGSTRPWAILAVGENGEPQKFAVKLFREYHLRQYPAVANEVFGSVLAAAFDLGTPATALITFSAEFLSTLGPEQLEQLRTVPDTPKFGTAFIEGCYPYSVALGAKALEDYDQETIYAFDNLILNVDRRPDKPNILLHGSDSYIIDHEMTLEGIPSAMNQLQRQQWEHYYRGHLFYDYLRTRGPERIRNSFQTFGYYLQNLDPRCLEAYQHQLDTFGLGCRRFDEVLRYFYYQKENFSQFEALLRRTLL